MDERALEQRAIDVIRGLAMDAPQRAHSGHPGTAMALAPLAHVLWTRILRHDPSDPAWPDRDRFILSPGHACVLLYALLYLTGYGLEVEDLRRFRQWGSRTPGHPEAGCAPGVEVTTGPLGQGFANSIGMAIAERTLRARFGEELFDHRTFVVCSDGDFEEGLSHEAASLAGHLRLGRLIAVYDNNQISIDGPTSLAFSDDTARRFEAYGWRVDRLGEVANDTDALEAGLRRAIAEEGRPSLLMIHSHIGWPSPSYTDTARAHGEPLGEDEVAATKSRMGLPPDRTFWVPDEVLALYRRCIPRGRALSRAWRERLEAWEGDRAVLGACLAGRGLPGWERALPAWRPGEPVATRKASGACLAALAGKVPGLMGGGADLTESTGTTLTGVGVQSAAEPGGRQIYFGVREHAMGAILVGLARHGGALPVGGTYLIFSDYMRPAVRLAALSRAHVVFAFTHDSVGLGQDGPTHQPIEQLASMRAMPGLRVIRPADANECAQAWRIAVESEGPTALVLTRQDLPVLEGTAGGERVWRGAYVLAECGRPGAPALVLIGTGSEVQLCLGAAERLAREGVPVRVVSMPSWDLFAAQPPTYRASVLPEQVPTLSVEAAASLGWERWADEAVAIDRFGASAPGQVVLEKLGFTASSVADRARALLERSRREGVR